jgi:hypothetical protein
MAAESWYLFGAVLLLLIIVLYYSFPTLVRWARPVLEFLGISPPLITTKKNDGPFQLSTVKSLFPSETTASFYNSTEATFQGFFFVVPLDRTASTPTGCVAPDCVNGVYGICDTQPNNAASANFELCKHPGYVPLFSIGQAVQFEVLTVPDASRQGRAMAQLVVQTRGPVPNGNLTFKVETMQLPALEFQKWVMITISRSGRRFDVYYNDRLVHSEKTKNMITNSTLDTSSGNERLSGAVALASMQNIRMNSLDVSNRYQALANTKGAPNVSSSADFGNDSVGLVPEVGRANQQFSLGDICANGNCSGPPTFRSSSPLVDWVTSYG